MATSPAGQVPSALRHVLREEGRAQQKAVLQSVFAKTMPSCAPDTPVSAGKTKGLTRSVTKEAYDEWDYVGRACCGHDSLSSAAEVSQNALMVPAVASLC
ncbi:hypothetical protein N2152v2_002312 [Parachlorella kessleri]